MNGKHFAGYRFPEPVKSMVIWDDFTDELALTSSEPVSASSPWIGTALTGGSTAQTTDENGGVLVLLATSSEDTGSQVQYDMENAALLTGKTLEYATRFKLSDSDGSDFFAGLAITDTTILSSSALTITDGIGFRVADGSTVIKIIVVRDSVVVASADLYASIADSTYYHVAFRVEMDSTTAGKGKVTAWIYTSPSGGTPTLVGHVTTSSVTMPYASEEILALSFALVSGDTATSTATIDYVYLDAER